MKRPCITLLASNSKLQISTCSEEVHSGKHAGIGKDIVEEYEIVELIRTTIEVFGCQGIGDSIPWLSFLDTLFLLDKQRFKQMKRQMDSFTSQIIQEHRQHQAANPGCPARDFVDMLLRISPSDMDGEAMTEPAARGE